MTNNNPESSPVFYARGSVIHRARAIDKSGAQVKVETVGRDGWLTQQKHHKSELFAELDLIGLGEDLIPEIQPGEEKSLDLVLSELLTDPDRASKLALRMGDKAVSRYISEKRTPDELGVLSVDELTGSADQKGSNRWKINELVGGIERRVYHEGVSNTLKTARPSQDAEWLSADELVALKNEIARNNREALDILYEENDVEFLQANTYKKDSADGKYQEITTVYPARKGLISFAEHAIYDRDTELPLPQDMKGFRVDIVVGIPTYTTERG